MALTGFDPAVVKTSIGNVKKAYDDLMKALQSDMQTKFVDKMADKWACKQAQTFFTSCKTSVDSLLSSSTETFQSVVDSMNSAAENWASNTDSNYSKVSFTANTKKLNVSSIKENINGVRGIDVASAKTTAATLTQIATSASTALTSAQQAVNDCGFVGGSMATNLISSLGKIKKNIDSVVKDLTKDVKDAIDSTVDTYSDTEGKISTAFAGK